MPLQPALRLSISQARAEFLNCDIYDIIVLEVADRAESFHSRPQCFKPAKDAR